jgi:hypothetical protein
MTSFVDRLQRLGWTDGRNIDYRWTAGDAERIRKGAAELAELMPDAILTSQRRWSRLAGRGPTACLGWEDSNSDIRTQAMYLRGRDNSRRLGQNRPPETVRV